MGVVVKSSKIPFNGLQTKKGEAEAGEAEGKGGRGGMRRIEEE